MQYNTMQCNTVTVVVIFEKRYHRYQSRRRLVQEQNIRIGDQRNASAHVNIRAIISQTVEN